MEDDIQTPTKKSPVIPTIAVLGFGLAAVATAMGAVALKKISRSAEEINERIEKNAAIELEVKKISDRLDSLALQIEDVKSASADKVKNLATRTQQVVDVLNGNINELRNEIVKDREAIEKLAKPAPKPVAKQQPEAEKKAEQHAQAEKPAPAGGAKIHKIKSGDTFGKLAKTYRVSTSAIIKANPNVNPNALRIGQEIVIP